MGAFWLVWLGTILVFVMLAAWLGVRIRGTIWAIFIDSRNTWSLSQFQLIAWTVAGLPLIFATAYWRALDDPGSAWSFGIPGELLALMGISLGSTGAALAIKSVKNTNRGLHIAARVTAVRNPPFSDLFATEEGEDGLRSVDATKFQNFMITVALLATYVWIVVAAFADLPDGQKVPTELPALSKEMVALLGLSHGGYLVGKIPNRAGNPRVAAEAAASVNPGARTITNMAQGS